MTCTSIKNIENLVDVGDTSQSHKFVQWFPIMVGLQQSC